MAPTTYVSTGSAILKKIHDGENVRRNWKRYESGLQSTPEQVTDAEIAKGIWLGLNFKH